MNQIVTLVTAHHSNKQSINPKQSISIFVMHKKIDVKQDKIKTAAAAAAAAAAARKRLMVFSVVHNLFKIKSDKPKRKRMHPSIFLFCFDSDFVLNERKKKNKNKKRRQTKKAQQQKK